MIDNYRVSDAMETTCPYWSTINRRYLADEATVIRSLLSSLSDYDPWKIQASARSLLSSLRANQDQPSVNTAFLQEYKLSNKEGVILMAMAETLLRIPDSETQNRLIEEKLTDADWRTHISHSPSTLVNVTTRALALTGHFEYYLKNSESGWQVTYAALLKRLGQGLIRNAIVHALQFLAYRFVMAETIEDALARSEQLPSYRYSFDMLGEAALCKEDSRRYFDQYRRAILAVKSADDSDSMPTTANISIKLSALCPFYRPSQHRRATAMLTDQLLILARLAKSCGVGLTIDAEESERLMMSLRVFKDVFQQAEFSRWSGLGIAVQAYQKRAYPILAWLAQLSKQQRKRISVRLVKGAYWDREIKYAQEAGLRNFPVFTHKSATDLSYLACAHFILNEPKAFYPQFASHNAHTLAAIHEMAHEHPGYEFQRLYGMGDSLYDEIIDNQNWQVPCRIYAPIGRYHELLPYLVRRLIENGANTSFVSQVDDPTVSIDEMTDDPVEYYRRQTRIKPSIPLPPDLFGQQRKNSLGLNVNDLSLLERFQQQLALLRQRHWLAQPIIPGLGIDGEQHSIVNPGDARDTVGAVTLAEPQHIRQAQTIAVASVGAWRQSSPESRSELLNNCADTFELHRLELVSLAIREAGKTVHDALAEVREAVDFCRYYSHCLLDLGHPQMLPGPTGERNLLYHYGRGVFVCISPWNFPIAIVIGQISAALAAGNSVIAKPSSLTPLTAMRCIELMHQAGIPEDVLLYVPAANADISEHLLARPGFAGVAFTGSTATAKSIERTLTKQHRQIIPLIAETGGQNVMIADSSALLEQVVNDALASAFNSVGQRCSALRVLFIQNDKAEALIALLTGAMQTLTIGNPQHYRTDVGPLINRQAVAQMREHLEHINKQAHRVFQVTLPEDLPQGNFFPPTLIEIDNLAQLHEEVFGPILHLIRYPADQLDRVIEAINASGYGLTLGIHSRLQSTIERIQQRVRVGNIYINRNMIGAVVGSQPFGGMGLSGTGPKAGGPHYLHRFSCEQTVSQNTAAIGGDAQLLARDLY